MAQISGSTDRSPATSPPKVLSYNRHISTIVECRSILIMSIASNNESNALEHELSLDVKWNTAKTL